tara:strand:+ start:58 stop:594 length:537 start_codon:yes stop_codon:yes gene_type:complete
MRLFFFFIIFILPIELKALSITDGTCKDRWMYTAYIDNATRQIYFWKTYLVDGHIARRSEFTYGFSFGNKLDCVKERNRKQNWDVQLIAARYANDPNARFVSFSHIEDEEFCKMSPELLIEYCDPLKQNDPNDNSIASSVNEDNSIRDKLYELKSMLDEGLISQEQYNDKSSKILDEF